MFAVRSSGLVEAGLGVVIREVGNSLGIQNGAESSSPSPPAVISSPA